MEFSSQCMAHLPLFMLSTIHYLTLFSLTIASSCDETLTGSGTDYSGCQNATVNCLTCQKWTEQSPHTHGFGSVGDHNYCRNPDDAYSIWCYTTDPDIRFAFCTPRSTSSPPCEAKLSTCNEALVGDGIGYRGCQNRTIEGLPCQKWTSQTPHSHRFNDSAYPNMGIGNHNYCRNPDGVVDTIWCYTIDPDTRWKYCEPMITLDPTTSPTYAPTPATAYPTTPPSLAPSMPPTSSPTSAPSVAPSNAPSIPPTSSPSTAPSVSPTLSPPPSVAPTASPTTCYENGNQVSDDGWELSISDMIKTLQFSNEVTGVMRVNTTFEIHGESLTFENQLEEEVICEAPAACHGGDSGSFSFRNMSICNVLCSAPYACYSRSVYIDDCQHSEIICNGTHSCEYMKVSMHSSSHGVLNVHCGLETSCGNLEINVLGNAVTSTACIGLNACDGLTINVDPKYYKNHKLQMFSYSDNITLSNGFGYEELNGSTKYVECHETSTYIQWNESLETDAQVRPLVLNEYEGGRFPCDAVTIECFQTNNSQSISSCEMKSTVKAESFKIANASRDPLAQCYWVEVDDILDISCTGDCVTSPTEAPTSSPTASPTDPTSDPTIDPTMEPTINPTLNPTLKPTIDPTRHPTLDPTNDPTIDPTIDPTKDPTIGPTIDPTIDPTSDPSTAPTRSPSAAPSGSPTTPPSHAPSQHPSVSPSIAPTTAPSISPSAPPTVAPSNAPFRSPSFSPSDSPSDAPSYTPSSAPTRVPTVDVDDSSDGYDYYINITYAIANLSVSNKQLMASNTLQVVHDFEEILESNYFDEEALEYKDFWLNIHRIDGVNVAGDNVKLTEYDLDINAYEDRANLIDARIEASQHGTGFIITRSGTTTFRKNTQNDLRNYLNESDLFFKIATDLEAVEAVDKSGIVEKEEPVNYDVVVFAIVVLVCGSLLSLMLLYINNMKGTKMDNVNAMATTMFSLQIYDFISDIFFCQDVRNNLVGHGGWILVCFIGAVIFTVYPFLSNIYYGVTITKQDVIIRNKRANEYFAANIALLIGLIVISGGCYNSLLVVSSNMFGLQEFSSGLTQHELSKLKKIKIRATIWTENVPQIAIQIAYTIAQHGDVGPAVVFAFIGSILSVIMTVASYYAQRNVNKDADVMSYYLRFEDKVGNITTDQVQKIENNKGRTKALTRAIVKTLNISEENLQIGYVWILNNGLEMNVSHFLTKAELAKHRRSDRGFVSEITPQEYLHLLYSDKHVKEGLNQVFRAHFRIADSNFSVKFVTDDPNPSTSVHLLGSDTGTPVTAADANPYQTIEMQTMGSMIEQMLELQRMRTRHMHGRNQHDIDDDDKQEDATEGDALLHHVSSTSGGYARRNPDLNTIWAELELLKRNQEEVMKNQEEAMKNQEEVMKNQEEVMKSIQEALEKK